MLRLMPLCWLVGVVSLALFFAPPLHGQSPRPPTLEQTAYQQLATVGLAPEQVSLLIYSTRQNRNLVAINPQMPRIPASTMKLITAWAAWHLLGPNHRWYTTFSPLLVPTTENSAALPPDLGAALHEVDLAQWDLGLMVEGGGDPLLSLKDLDHIAAMLMAAGLHQLKQMNGPLVLDQSYYSEPAFPEAWGLKGEGESWRTPVTALALERNRIPFTIVVPAQASLPEDVYVFSPLPIAIRNLLRPQGHTLSYWAQQQTPTQNNGEYSLVLRGRVPQQQGLFEQVVPVAHPQDFWAQFLRMALWRKGLPAELPLTTLSPEMTVGETLYRHPSVPLRQVLPVMLKDSDNMIAEAMLRTMGANQEQTSTHTPTGLAAVYDLLQGQFGALSRQVVMVDGAGLSTENRVTAQFLVELLRQVVARQPDMNEWIGALPRSGEDGTLTERALPETMQGLLRAKTGTLRGVQNLAGLLRIPAQNGQPEDVLLLAFLVHSPRTPTFRLQQAVDAVLTALFEAIYSAGEQRTQDTPPPAVITPPLPAAPKNTN